MHAGFECCSVTKMYQLTKVFPISNKQTGLFQQYRNMKELESDHIKNIEEELDIISESSNDVVTLEEEADKEELERYTVIYDVVAANSKPTQTVKARCTRSTCAYFVNWMQINKKLEIKPKTSEKQVATSKKYTKDKKCSLAACFCTFPREIIDDRDQYRSINKDSKSNRALEVSHQSKATHFEETYCEQLVTKSQSERLNRPILHFMCPTEFEVVTCSLSNCPLVREKTFSKQVDHLEEETVTMEVEIETDQNTTVDKKTLSQNKSANVQENKPFLVSGATASIPAMQQKCWYSQSNEENDYSCHCLEEISKETQTETAIGLPTNLKYYVLRNGSYHEFVPKEEQPDSRKRKGSIFSYFKFGRNK
ncbi:hypothetical protein ILUMI_10916 [Ignelater luminosus]|uniref:Uncharacterized protein n=1 Tax=Ignelater luminosus TaxID=2038154 RepID=A0A8K0D172_IGNLU|nr:hypothetical protein ILUMI_10916 [Ignelater luminosus]